MPTEPPKPEDAFLAELLDDVLADHTDLPPEVVAEMRWFLELIAETHPTVSPMVNRARPRQAPLQSGAQEKPAVDPTTVVSDADDDRREGTEG